jgi:cytochrome b
MISGSSMLARIASRPPQRAQLLTVTLVGLSGWLYTTDRFWGVEWVEELHSTSADLLLVLAAAHVAGALYASFHHRENLVASMQHGCKRL